MAHKHSGLMQVIRDNYIPFLELLAKESMKPEVEKDDIKRREIVDKIYNNLDKYIWINTLCYCDCDSSDNLDCTVCSTQGYYLVKEPILRENATQNYIDTQTTPPSKAKYLEICGLNVPENGRTIKPALRYKHKKSFPTANPYI